MKKTSTRSEAEAIRRALADRSIVLIGLMGAGKTSVGRRLAKRLGLAFADADHEIEAAAGMPITDIFERHGEQGFRDGERRVIARLLRSGPQVLATGGGAFMSARTRQRIARRAVSVWLKADHGLLMQRVRKRSHRPLLQTPDPDAVMQKLMDERYPVYAKADLVVECHDVPLNAMVGEVVRVLYDNLAVLEKKNMDGEGVCIEVDLDDRSYPIHIGEGLLKQAGRLTGGLLARPRTVIVSDENVARYHLATLEKSLSDSGIESQAVILPAGEATKSYQQLAALCDKLLEAGVEREDVIIAFGGGVIGDITGFAASVLRRGVGFIQIPTSLLAQVDSSVGGKTAINSPLGKNLIGAFHQPLAVIADIAVLDTLSPRELAAGYAEVAKYGLLGDAGFFEWLEDNGEKIFAGDGQARISAIAKSCQAKAGIVGRDETEQGVRALLNLGHTFGHALEAATGYCDRLLHGEGVSIGMVMAFKFSERAGLAPEGTAERVARHLASVGLPTGPGDISGELPAAEDLLAFMHQDKKAKQGRLVFVLARAIGDSFVDDSVSPDDVLDFLKEELKNR